MTLITFGQLFTVCLLGAMSPGPSMAVVVRNAIFKGRYNGILTSIGHGIGISIYATFAVLGLGLIIKNNLYVFTLLKIISIVFLIFIGIKSLFNKEKLNLEKKDEKENTISFLEGFSISILNPKILVWFTVIFSQFIRPTDVIEYSLILITTAGIVDMLWYISLTLFISSSHFKRILKNQVNLIQYIIGFSFIIIGGLLFIEQLNNWII